MNSLGMKLIAAGAALMGAEAAKIKHLDHGLVYHEAHYFHTPQTKQSNFHVHPKTKASKLSAQVTDMGGEMGQTVAYYASKKAGDKTKVGVMLAGNSGLPGGNMGHHMELKSYPTQEEDMMASWFIAQAGLKKNSDIRTAYAKKVARKIYGSVIGGRWGMKHVKGTDLKTVQGVDYVNTKNPERYGSVWMVDGTVLVDKVFTGRYEKKFDKKTRKMKEVKVYKFDVRRKTNRNILLTFVAGPNCGFAGRGKNNKTSTGLRTLNAACKAIKWFPRNPAAGRAFLDDGRKAAMRAALYGMVARGARVAVVADVSGALYAGKYQLYDNMGKKYAKKGLNPDWKPAKRIIEELLAERPSGAKGPTLGQYFEEVHVPSS